MTALLALHFWLVRKAGGVVLPRREPGEPSAREELVSASPALTLREGVFGLVVIAVVMLTSAGVDAPLLAQANPGVSPNPAKAPWYFMGVQELLVHVHPLFAMLVPLLALALLASLPSLAGNARASGHWFESPRGARLALKAGAAGAALAAAVVLADEALRRRPPALPGLPALVRGGLLPALVAIAAAGVALLSQRRGASRVEVIQTVFTFSAAAFAAWTVTGVLFRGPGMALAWPWATPLVGVGP